MSSRPRQLVLEITGILGQPDTVNAYFLADGGEAVLVDAGRDPRVDRRRILEAWRGLGEPRVRGILLTHAHVDHVGAAGALRELWQAPVAMHPAGVPLLREQGIDLTPDRLLEDGEAVGTPVGEFRVLLTPGHAPGHVCFYREADGLLLSGDQALGNGTTYVGEPHGNMTEYLESSRRLLALRVGTLAPGHGPVLPDGHARLVELHEYRLRREGELLMALRSGLTTEEAIAGRLYRGMPAVVVRFGVNQTRSHLEHLERVGAVARQGGGWVVAGG